jgi:hypothetical protein
MGRGRVVVPGEPLHFMKKLFAFILIILVTASAVFAQQRRPNERIHAAKIAYITDRLHLTADQSGNFVPLFNQYEHDIWETRQTFYKKYNGPDPGTADDATYRQYVDDNLDYQQQVIDIKRKYNDRFLKIITPQQLADLPKAEREFRQILMKQLEKRHNNGRNNNNYRRNGNGY